MGGERHTFRFMKVSPRLILLAVSIATASGCAVANPYDVKKFAPDYEPSPIISKTSETLEIGVVLHEDNEHVRELVEPSFIKGIEKFVSKYASNWKVQKADGTSQASLILKAVVAYRGLMSDPYICHCRLFGITAKPREFEVKMDSQIIGSFIKDENTRTQSTNFGMLTAKEMFKIIDAQWGTLYGASRGGKTDIIKYYIDEGVDINVPDADGLTALHHAVLEGRTETVHFLLYWNADPALSDKDGRTPLWIASSMGNADIVGTLLLQQIDPNVADKNGRTPLMEASSQGHSKVVELLLQNKADPQLQDANRQTALMLTPPHREDIKTILQQATGAEPRVPKRPAPIAAEPEIQTSQIVSKNITLLSPKLQSFPVSDTNTFLVKGMVQGQSQTIAVYVNDIAATLTALLEGTEFVASIPYTGPDMTLRIDAIDRKGGMEKEVIALSSLPLAPTGINFGKYHALLIGINQYPHLTNLQTAEQDAKALHQILSNQYGFNSQLLLNPTRSEIIEKLSRYRSTLGEHDNLLIYYAGHGWLDKEADEGYWLPTNATDKDISQWLSTATITSSIRAMQAKHVFVIADSCYSGMLTRDLHIQPKTYAYLERLATKKTRVVLSSGGLEPVADQGGSGDHSIFASNLLKALEENTGIMEGTALFSKIRRPIILNSDQTPEYGDIRKAGHEGGDFIFVRQ